MLVKTPRWRFKLTGQTEFSQPRFPKQNYIKPLPFVSLSLQQVGKDGLQYSSHRESRQQKSLADYIRSVEFTKSGTPLSQK